MNENQFHKLSAVFDAIIDGICISNVDCTIEFMNIAMIEMFGDGIGKKCYEVVNCKNDICPRCQTGEVFENRASFYCKICMSNMDVGYEAFVIPFYNQDGSASKLSIYRDVAHGTINNGNCLKIFKEDYRRIFEHVAVGVFISSKEGKFIDANPALLDMLGYENKMEFLDLDLSRDLYLKPEERAKFQRMIEFEKKVINYNVKWKCKDGNFISVSLTAHVRYGINCDIIGYEGICVDQSQRLRMERELREAHEFLNKTIQSSPNAIMATDMKGKIIMWNKGAYEIFGYNSSEIVGKMNVKNLYPNNFAKKVMKMIRSDDYGGAGKLRSCPISLMTKDGRMVEGNFSANIIYNDKMEEMASVGIFVDLHEQLAMERKLLVTQEQLLQSEKLAAMGRLTSQIAHELNNPLYGIMNTFELLKTEIKPNNKRRKILDMALSETERLADMLRKMLSFSKPDQEQRSLVDVNDILDEILLLHEKQLCERSIKIITHMSKTIYKVYASKNQLRQVFLNMISNARDAMPDGGSLTVSTENVSNFINITIIDTGVGIRREHLDLIFETFFTTKTDSIKGVGLGLSVCYGFIKDHGGDIRVDSKLGNGSSFIISLPVSND